MTQFQDLGLTAIVTAEVRTPADAEESSMSDDLQVPEHDEPAPVEPATQEGLVESVDVSPADSAEDAPGDLSPEERQDEQVALAEIQIDAGMAPNEGDQSGVAPADRGAGDAVPAVEREEYLVEVGAKEADEPQSDDDEVNADGFKAQAGELFGGPDAGQAVHETSNEGFLVGESTENEARPLDEPAGNEAADIEAREASEAEAGEAEVEEV